MITVWAFAAPGCGQAAEADAALDCARAGLEIAAAAVNAKTISRDKLATSWILLIRTYG
jgi:hypothetical protein